MFVVVRRRTVAVQLHSFCQRSFSRFSWFHICSGCVAVLSLAAAMHGVTIIQVCTSLRWTLTVATLEILSCGVILLIASGMYTAASINIQAMAIVAFISQLCPFPVFCALLVLASVLMHIDSLCDLLCGNLQSSTKRDNCNTSANSFRSFRSSRSRDSTTVKCTVVCAAVINLFELCPFAFAMFCTLVVHVLVVIHINSICHRLRGIVSSNFREITNSFFGSVVQRFRFSLTAANLHLVCTVAFSAFHSATHYSRSLATSGNFGLVCTVAMNAFGGAVAAIGGSAITCVGSPFITALNFPLVWMILTIIPPQLLQSLAYRDDFVAYARCSGALVKCRGVFMAAVAACPCAARFMLSLTTRANCRLLCTIALNAISAAVNCVRSPLIRALNCPLAWTALLMLIPPQLLQYVPYRGDCVASGIVMVFMSFRCKPRLSTLTGQSTFLQCVLFTWLQ